MPAETVQVIRTWTYRGWDFTTVKVEGGTVWKVRAKRGVRVVVLHKKVIDCSMVYVEGRVKDEVDRLEESRPVEPQ